MGACISKIKDETESKQAIPKTTMSPPVASLAAPAPPSTKMLTGAERGHDVLRQLLISNKGYIAGDSSPQSQISPPKLRVHLAEKGQTPDACVIACADSRVSPEIIFNAGLGKLFVIRNAGNVTWGDSVLGSTEYAVAALNVPLVIVLGHSMCGAVGAAVSTCKGEASLPGALGLHVERISEVVKGCVGGENEVKDSVLHNVREGVKSLREAANPVGEAYRKKECLIVGGVYDLLAGEVQIIDPSD